jgi:lipopolysaccharide assembly outer membrane protein LptD (OstA)
MALIGAGNRIVLFADKVRWDQRPNRLTAEGNVRLTQSGAEGKEVTTRDSRMTYDVNTAQLRVE